MKRDLAESSPLEEILIDCQPLRPIINNGNNLDMLLPQLPKLALPIVTRPLPILNLLARIRDASIAVLIKLLGQLPEPMAKIRILLADLLILLLELADLLPKLVDVSVAVRRRRRRAGVLEGAAEGVVLGLKGGDLLLELGDDDLAEVVELAFVGGEAGAEGVVLVAEGLVGGFEGAVALHEGFPFFAANFIRVALVTMVVVGFGALE